LGWRAYDIHHLNGRYYDRCYARGDSKEFIRVFRDPISGEYSFETYLPPWNGRGLAAPTKKHHRSKASKRFRWRRKSPTLDDLPEIPPG